MKVEFYPDFLDNTWVETGDLDLTVMPKDLEARNRFSCALEDSRDEEREELSVNDLMLSFVCKNVFTADEKFSIHLSANCSLWDLEYGPEMPQFKALLEAMVNSQVAVVESGSSDDADAARSRLGFMRMCISACE